jgi:hypothetical protein
VHVGDSQRNAACVAVRTCIRMISRNRSQTHTSTPAHPPTALAPHILTTQSPFPPRPQLTFIDRDAIASPVRQRSLDDKLLTDEKSQRRITGGSAGSAGMIMGGGTVAGRVTGVLGFPAKREMGDCYVWGSSGPQPETGALPEPVPGWQQSPWPVMVAHTGTLDVVQVRGGGAGLLWWGV